MEKSKELKPCPWCGKGSVLYERGDGLVSILHDCDHLQDVIEVMMEREAAIRAWNERKEEPGR